MTDEHKPEWADREADFLADGFELDDHSLEPFDGWSLNGKAELGIDSAPLAQRLQSQARWYLLQVRCALPVEDQGDPHQTAIDILANSIWVLGGRVEQQWRTPGEFDLILVMRLQSHQISISSVEMALTAMELVKSLRVTPLQLLDEPQEGIDAGIVTRHEPRNCDYEVIADALQAANLD